MSERPSLTTALEELKKNTQDMTATLKAVMATDALAMAIHYCRATFYSLPATHWDDLSDVQRDIFRQRARLFLEALGQNITTTDAQAMGAEEAVPAYARWFPGRDAMFKELVWQAEAAVDKMRSANQVAEADYTTEAGRQQNRRTDIKVILATS